MEPEEKGQVSGMEFAIARILAPAAHDPTALKVLDEDGFDRVAKILLQYGLQGWSTIPRTYAILHNIDCSQYASLFIDDDVRDAAIPHSRTSLPPGLSDNIRNKFIEGQHIALTVKASFDRIMQGRHVHVHAFSELKLEDRGNLGKGGQAYVKKVFDEVTGREYAVKLIKRKDSFSEETAALKQFQTELVAARKVKHRHIIDIVGSFTDIDHVGFFMSTVGDCNLETFLATEMSPSKKGVLRDFFGCLASALFALHDANVRHKDIKPQNLIIKGSTIYLADFGIAIAFETPTKTTGPGPPGIMSAMYCAPEVADKDKRNESSDMWSLGVVFLEMATVLVGSTLPELEKFLNTHGTLVSGRYYWNIQGIQEWIESLQAGSGAKNDRFTLDWTLGLAKGDPTSRLTAKALLEIIREDATKAEYYFCCEICRSMHGKSTFMIEEAKNVESQAHTAATAAPIEIVAANENTSQVDDAHSDETATEAKNQASVSKSNSEDRELSAASKDSVKSAALKATASAPRGATKSPEGSIALQRETSIATRTPEATSHFQRSESAVDVQRSKSTVQSHSNARQATVWSQWLWSEPHHQHYCWMREPNGSIRYAFSDGTQQLSESTSHSTSEVDSENEDDEQDEDEETDESEEEEHEDNVQTFPYHSSGIATQRAGGSSSRYGGYRNSAALARPESKPLRSSLDRDSTASGRTAVNNGTPQTRRYQTFVNPSRLEGQGPTCTTGGAWALGGAAFGAIIFASGVYVGSTIKASATLGANAAAVRRRRATSDYAAQHNPTQFFVLGKVFAVFLSTRTDVTPFINPVLDGRATAPSETKQHFFVVTVQKAHLFYCSPIIDLSEIHLLERKQCINFFPFDTIGNGRSERRFWNPAELSLLGEYAERMRMVSITVARSNEAALPRHSRIDLGKMIPFEYEVSVRNIGTVESPYVEYLVHEMKQRWRLDTERPEYKWTSVPLSDEVKVNPDYNPTSVLSPILYSNGTDMTIHETNATAYQTLNGTYLGGMATLTKARVPPNLGIWGMGLEEKVATDEPEDEIENANEVEDEDDDSDETDDDD